MAQLEAKELVEGIAKSHGHLGEEVYAQIENPELRRQMREAIKKKDELIGSSVITWVIVHSFHCAR